MQIELLNRRRWDTGLELANAIFEHLELFHSRQRGDSSLGPIEYELRHANSSPAIKQVDRVEPWAYEPPPDPGALYAATTTSLAIR